MEALALDHVFDELNLHKLSCEVLAFNAPVINLHKKFGFEVEGIFREQYLIGGKFVDVYRLGILAAEWRESRPRIVEKLQKYSKT
jgi:RimJ/RimL family protein N-acetyltransferase